jgi:hypothetical protein
MKKNLFLTIHIFLIIGVLCVLPGCETLKGFSGKDKGSEKISRGFERDLNNIWDKVMRFDAMLREKLW